MSWSSTKQEISKPEIDWHPILQQMQSAGELPIYPGDLKTALLKHAGLSHHPQGEQAYEIAVEIARLTTCCDPEIVYWFSRLAALVSRSN